MRGRPLCVVLLLMTAGIVFFHSRWERELVSYDGEQRTLICELEEITEQENTFTLLVKDVHSGQEKLCHRMKLYTRKDTDIPEELHIGNLLQVEASVYSFSKPGNPGQFNEYQYNMQQGIAYKAFVSKISVKSYRKDVIRDGLYKLRCHFRQILDRCCEEETAGILAAMTLGDKGELSEEAKQLYQDNGIAHILAISGLHISLVGAGLFYFLRQFVMPMQAAVAVTMLFLILYGILTGFSVSTQRAVTMMACLLFARLAGRQYDALSALSFSAILQLSLHPLVLFQTGFLLSYGTVLGILLFVRRWQETEEEKSFLPGTVTGSLGIQFVTLPILLYAYYEIPLYSVFVNVLLLPLMGGILLTALGGMAVGSLWLLLGRFTFGMAHYCLTLIHAVCRFFSQLPYHTIILGRPTGWQIVLYYTGLFLFCVMPEKISLRWKRLLLLGSLLLLCLPVHRVSGVQITSLDVGQGDCTCIRTAGKTLLVDGGSSDVKEVAKYRIVPYLKSQGISRLEYLFITHSDSDHTSGIQEILADEKHMGLELGKVVLPALQKQDEAYRTLYELCRRTGVPVVFMERGDRITLGELALSCLHPYAAYDWKSENNYSLVLQLRYRKFTGYLTGDLETEGEQEILQQVGTAAYLKVGHHGSKGASSEAFLGKIRPKTAVFSAGKGNRYGHPAQEVKERFYMLGTRTYCTIDGGAVTVETDGEQMWVENYRNFVKPDIVYL